MRHRRIRRSPVPYPARPPIPDGILVHRVVPRPTAWSDPVDPAPRFRVHHQVSSSARRRWSDLRWSGTGGCLVRPVRLVTRRLLVVPPDLDTPVPVAEPLVPFPKERASVVAVLPEHDSGAFPGSRSSVRPRCLSPGAFWWNGSIRFRIPSPCSAWTHDGPGWAKGQQEADLSPEAGIISPAPERLIHSAIHRTRPDRPSGPAFRTRFQERSSGAQCGTGQQRAEGGQKADPTGRPAQRR